MPSPVCEYFSSSSRSTTNQIFCIHQIQIKNWEYNGSVHQLCIMGEVLHNILTEFGMAMKLVRLITMYLNETHSKVCIHKILTYLGRICTLKRRSKVSLILYKGSSSGSSPGTSGSLLFMYNRARIAEYQS
jgi:hypothetical protein